MFTIRRLTILIAVIDLIATLVTAFGVLITYLEGFSNFWLIYNIANILLIIASYLLNLLLISKKRKI